ncbi:class I SAM-dependent methyltransferase [Candidatus Woesearchaeota archaeon]|nr:class I SAM-dependent methyltransferase [Candidatus Woesearchaeota archaeon]
MINKSGTGLVAFEDASVFIQQRAVRNWYDELMRQMVPVSFDFVQTPAPSEAAFFRNQGIEATTSFERNRKRVETSLIKLVRFVWSHYNLPRRRVVEYGSGATGYFDAVLRPREVQEWLQVETNPLAIAENRRRNPAAQVVEGTYYDIPYRDEELIVGLSSFDTASNLSAAIHQVAGALRPGGYFLHVQDVRPGVHFQREYLKKAGIPLPTKMFEAGKGNPIGYIINGQPSSSTDIFQDAMGAAIHEHHDLELLTNRYHTLVEFQPGDVRQEVYFLNLYLELGLPPNAPQRLRETTMIVTLAQKVDR